MPRGARLDAPGTLHHVMVRGIDRRNIVDDEKDREDFVFRLGKLSEETGTAIYAWALMTNHAHILIRSGPGGLPNFKRRLLAGYAAAYNRRHKRFGHLFQNRYKSIICEEDPYFKELVRYIHLNPLRAALVGTMSRLKCYKWSGHSALLGTRKTIGRILNMFSNGMVRLKALRAAPILSSSNKGSIKGDGLNWWAGVSSVLWAGGGW